MKFNRFEDIIAWQKAREICGQIYVATSSNDFAMDYALRDQTRRAAISIMANIAEGFPRNTDKEFRQFLFIAKGSTSELQSHLYIALDQHYLDTTRFDSINNNLEHLAKMLSNLIKYLAKPSKPDRLNRLLRFDRLHRLNRSDRPDRPQRPNRLNDY